MSSSNREQIVKEIQERADTIRQQEDVVHVMRELWGNITGQHFIDPETSGRGALEWYGISKVVQIVAIVAVCQERGVDVSLMKMTPDEVAAEQARQIKVMLDAGKPVIGVIVDRDQKESS